MDPEWPSNSTTSWELSCRDPIRFWASPWKGGKARDRLRDPGWVGFGPRPGSEAQSSTSRLSRACARVGKRAASEGTCPKISRHRGDKAGTVSAQQTRQRDCPVFRAPAPLLQKWAADPAGRGLLKPEAFWAGTCLSRSGAGDWAGTFWRQPGPAGSPGPLLWPHILQVGRNPCSYLCEATLGHGVGVLPEAPLQPRGTPVSRHRARGAVGCRDLEIDLLAVPGPGWTLRGHGGASLCMSWPEYEPLGQGKRRQGGRPRPGAAPGLAAPLPWSPGPPPSVPRGPPHLTPLGHRKLGSTRAAPGQQQRRQRMGQGGGSRGRCGAPPPHSSFDVWERLEPQSQGGQSGGICLPRCVRSRPRPLC
ncbi:uncharacterized protein LOC116591935 [Mustela erminea]|uniref:uncharacterized protein LOC116591935 n=1 Tax=Mustela erminea TaxID=36723 RepID=UPI001386B4CA|nr:uncharacterized protein LOC116591935 [Mustela erminea]XP_032201288.1 uncharacterized protein LOC116591935 [Mustela erminea]XP_032201289.1 uncharacterized protein LOC116591935 [Mustela erminea]XP_032201290.1 uncharacterized protein LOC116591935 [Mustela erminea]